MGGLRRWIGRAAAAAFALAAVPVLAAPAACQLVKIGELSVTTARNESLAAVSINGRAAQMLMDTGAARSSLWRPALESLGLHSVHSDVKFYGVGGTDQADTVTVRDFALGGYVVHDLTLFVLGHGTQPGAFAGSLGEDFLSKLDVEFDLRAHSIRFFTPKNCSGDEVVYWAKAYSMIRLVHPIGAGDQPYVKVVLNGHEVLAVLDSGATVSMVTSEVAARTGGGPAVAASSTRGIAGQPLATSVAVFPTLSVGQEQIQNVTLRIADLFGRDKEVRAGSWIPTDPGSQPDMLIGADFFLAHRIYIARSQGKVYFTYQGGPIFQTEAPAPTASAAQAGVADGPDRGGKANDAPAGATEPAQPGTTHP
jgi:predicted aspartyl protease